MLQYILLFGGVPPHNIDLIIFLNPDESRHNSLQWECHELTDHFFEETID